MDAPANSVQFVISLKLRDNAHRDEFLRLSGLLQAWLAPRPGFLRYELFETADGWFYAILWRDQASAQAGNGAFMTSDLAREFSKIVQPGLHAISGKLTEV
jgi:hypothetical protein